MNILQNQIAEGDHNRLRSQELQLAELIIENSPAILFRRLAADDHKASSRTGEMFGKKRFKDIIRRNASKPAAEILRAIFQEHADFLSGVKTEDDITLVVVKIV